MICDNQSKDMLSVIYARFLPKHIYIGSNVTTHITLDGNSTYFVIIRSSYNVGAVCFVQTGDLASSCSITELTRSDYFTFAAAGTRTIAVQSGSATGDLFAIKLTD